MAEEVPSELEYQIFCRSKTCIYIIYVYIHTYIYTYFFKKLSMLVAFLSSVNGDT